MILSLSRTSQPDLTMLPTSLYIHVPWCIRKCPYCDFNSHKSPEVLPENQYVTALVNDFKQDLTYFPTRKINTIFIGGGTPSLLSAEAYESLFTQLQQWVLFAPDIEITLEANPGTVEQQRFHDYRQLGINRLSLGIQSFNPLHLKALGRIHNEKQAHNAIDAARQAGFTNINIDLMHGLPGQSVAQGIADLTSALTHEPEHLSWYQLTIEPNTVFYKHPPVLPDEDELSLIEEQGLAQIAQNGYQRYEISAFCKSTPSKHNLNYWLFGDYYGIGAGAHGKITTDHVFRTRKHRQPNEYLDPAKRFLAAKEQIDATSLVFEFMLNTTRLEQPIPHSLFQERTGLPFALLEPHLQQAADIELIAINDQFWQVTALGRRYTNNLQAMFLPE